MMTGHRAVLRKGRDSTSEDRNKTVATEQLEVKCEHL